MSHNFAVTCHRGELVGFGGRWRMLPQQWTREPGIHVVRATAPPSRKEHARLHSRLAAVNASARGSPLLNWSVPRLTLNGTHAGCVERRRSFSLQCEECPPRALSSRVSVCQ